MAPMGGEMNSNDDTQFAAGYAMDRRWRPARCSLQSLLAGVVIEALPYQW
jgi:hypothetical protein